MTEAAREAVLNGFMITPPAHSSKDETITLSITTTDTGTVNGSTVSDTVTVGRDVKITVTPVAERTDSDSDGANGNDVTMTPGYDYTTAGEEDAWFTLGTEGGFDLATGWSNEDSGEQTYASLTPVLKGGDGSMPDAIGSQFKWGGGSPVTYTGSPILVPIDKLDTLEFKAAPNFAGLFEIEVKAHTVDPGDDDNDVAVSDTSDQIAWLKNIVIKPAADQVTVTINPATGKEDNDIPLEITPFSGDPNETFNVTISDIPSGSTILYGGTDVQTISDGSVVVTDNGASYSVKFIDFDSNTTLSIKPPHNSNENIDLKINAESVDVLIVPGREPGDPDRRYEDTKAIEKELDLSVTVIGVADEAEIETHTVSAYTEAGIDGGPESIKLSDLATVNLTDTDGSETLNIRVSGLPDGFTPSAGTLLNPGSTGADRIWVLTEDQFTNATLNVPANYSGTVTFQIGAVTTENDGNSLTGEPKDVTITITPSPEAETTTSFELTEDVLEKIDLKIVHQNGDTDETLTGLRIAVDDVEGTAKFTLYLDDGSGTPKTLAQALTAGDITQTTEGGVTYYVLGSAQIGQLAAQGNAHLDDGLGGFRFQYEITDSHYGSTASGNTTSVWKDGNFSLTAKPVTDDPDASITGITGTKGTTTATDAIPGDDATNETVTLTEADTVTVNLQVTSPDTDGSEHLIRIVIDDVPDGVTVTDAEFIGGSQWLLIYDGTDAKPIPGGLSVPVKFVVNGFADGISNHEITLTPQVQDRGNLSGQDTAVESDSVSWILNTDFSGQGPGDNPATIITWAYKDVPATEDTQFALSDLINAGVTVNNATVDNMFTVTLEGLPAGTTVDGMIFTTITEGGVPREVWSKSIISNAGDDQAAIDALLQNLMDGIHITPPKDANDNNAAGEFKFDAKLTTSIVGGSNRDEETITAVGSDTGTGDKPLVVPVTPDTDQAVIDIVLDSAAPGGELNESDNDIPISLTISNAADGTHGNIVDGKLYLQISSADAPALDGGTLTINETTYTLETVGAVGDIPGGQYYVIDGVNMGDALSLVYTPPGSMSAGQVTVKAWVLNTESGSAQETGNAPLTSAGSTTLDVHLSNDGTTLTGGSFTGNEVGTGATGKDSVQLQGLEVGLNDNDDSETIVSVLLSNLPDGFLVFTGADAGSATQAANAGGDGTHNTWVIPLDDGKLPAYIGILPPPYWSGTLTGLKLIVESGEKTLSSTEIETHDLPDVTVEAVANGLTLDPTLSFGAENEIIKLNLNATMQDPDDATDQDLKDSGGNPVAPDGSIETTTLKLTGLGEHASFYIGTTLLEAGRVSYDADTYTLTGLTQADLNTLGFMQAASALTDQDGAAGVQIKVEAWTVETNDAGLPVGDPSDAVETTITVNLSEQYGTTGNDALIWTGDAIDGRSGTDTIHLRSGETLSGADLAAKLSNIEVIDLNIGGANQISGLTPDQVKTIFGEGDGTATGLTITGNAEDSVGLSGAWVEGEDGTWTGTLDDGTTTITLKIEGGATVDETAVTTSSSGSESFAAMAFGFPDAPADGDATAFLFGHDGDDLPGLDAVLTLPTWNGEDEDTSGTWLPGQDAGDASSSAQTGSTAGGEAPAYVPDPTQPDDELEQNLANAYALG